MTAFFSVMKNFGRQRIVISEKPSTPVVTNSSINIVTEAQTAKPELDICSTNISTPSEDVSNTSNTTMAIYDEIPLVTKIMTISNDEEIEQLKSSVLSNDSEDVVEANLLKQSDEDIPNSSKTSNEKNETQITQLSSNTDNSEVHNPRIKRLKRKQTKQTYTYSDQSSDEDLKRISAASSLNRNKTTANNRRMKRAKVRKCKIDATRSSNEEAIPRLSLRSESGEEVNPKSFLRSESERSSTESSSIGDHQFMDESVSSDNSEVNHRALFQSIVEKDNQEDDQNFFER